MEMKRPPVAWLLASDEPWTRLRTRIDLLGQGDDDAPVTADRRAMLADSRLLGLQEIAATWPGYALKRHNDARHPLHAITVLADFGLRASDAGMNPVIEQILARQDAEGPFLTHLRLYKRFGGLDGEYDSWMLCDTPLLTYALLAFGLVDDPRVLAAASHLRALGRENGWPCAASPMLGGFKGPGRRDDPCPIANLAVLKALSQIPGCLDSPEARRGAETLLRHWHDFAQARNLAETEAAYKPRKLFLFGVGTDFRKLKYPYVWYDILHAADVLSRYPFVQDDPRFLQMVETIMGQADENGCFAPTSMYRAWNGWSFADKKRPSPWLTFLAWRITRRLERPPISPQKRGGLPAV